MRRRDFLKSSFVGAVALAAPRIVRGEAQKTITFVPHADLASRYVIAAGTGGLCGMKLHRNPQREGLAAPV